MSRQRRKLFVIVAALFAALAVGGLWWHTAHRAAVRIPNARRQVTVRALWYSPDEQTPISGTTTVVVQIEPNDVPGVRIGFYEDEAHGSGDTWRASGWMAAVVASLEAGVDLQQYTPSFWAEGRIDGASAGALLTVAILAALTERDLPTNATITGSVNPDGTIGPTGGIALKIEAAAEAGIRRVLIPRGHGKAQEPTSERTLDLIALGQVKGVEVVEVGDVAEAYARLTGRTLHKPSGRHIPQGLPPPVSTELESRARSWLAKYREEAAACDRLQRRMGRRALDLQAEITAAQQAAAKAEQHLAEGKVAVAYDQAVQAALQVATALDLLKASQALALEGMPGAMRTVTPRNDRLAEIRITAAQLCSQMADTADGVLAAADALGATAQAAGLLRLRKGLLHTLEANLDEPGAVDTLFQAAVLQGIDRHLLPLAHDRAMLLGSRKGRPLSAPRRLTAWSTTMERAASANLGYFEDVVLGDKPQFLGLPPEVVQEAANNAYEDPTYLIAQASLVGLPDLEEALNQVQRYQTAVLGTSVGAYAAGAAVMTKFLTLSTKRDSSGHVVPVHNRAALDRLVNSARDGALRDIAAARAVGLEVSVPIFYYLAATEHILGDDDSKFEALRAYWQASLYARIGRMLAG